jgi:hypothetical protein
LIGRSLLHLYRAQFTVLLHPAHVARCADSQTNGLADGPPEHHSRPPSLTIGGCIYIASAAPWFFILAGVWVAIGMLALAVLIVAACRLPALALVTVGRPALGVGNHFSSVAQLRSRDDGQ